MKSCYIYYPRALRHFRDLAGCLQDAVDNGFTSDFEITDHKTNGDSIDIQIKTKQKRHYYKATYYRFGLLKVFSNQNTTEAILLGIAQKLWSFAFKNSVISVTTFKNGVPQAGHFFENGTGLESDVKGFCEVVIQILDGIGDHNRALFKELEAAYAASPYKEFLKIVQQDRFSCLAIYISRLDQILQSILQFEVLYLDQLDDKMKREIGNIKNEATYLLKLVELTERFFEKRYSAALHVKQNRETRIALITSIIACIAAIYAIVFNGSGSNKPANNASKQDSMKQTTNAPKDTVVSKDIDKRQHLDSSKRLRDTNVKKLDPVNKTKKLLTHGY